MLSKLAVRRLTKLADYMDALPKEANEHFYMGDWFIHDGKHEHHFSKRAITRRDLEFCGTSACAMGWASTIPAFRKAGLSVAPNSNLLLAGYQPKGSLFEIIDRFFNIQREHSEHLFSGRIQVKVKTPKQWAKHCRKFLRDNA